jgi:putative DNA methylase
MAQGETITRRNLPHWYVPGAMHFVTYRLAGTIPADRLHVLREQRTALLKLRPPAGETPQEHKARAHKRFFADYDRCLDSRCNIDWLARPAIAGLVRGNLHHHNRTKYHLLAYCVMPNHVHALFQPLSNGPSSPQPSPNEEGSDEGPDSLSPLAGIMHSLKSYTAHEANRILGRSGAFWQHESYDHWVRDDDELERIVSYIAWNPVKARRVNQPQEWYWSSAHDRFLQDGSTEGYLC